MKRWTEFCTSTELQSSRCASTTLDRFISNTVSFYTVLLIKHFCCFKVENSSGVKMSNLVTDEMGLGKTITVIGLISKNPANIPVIPDRKGWSDEINSSTHWTSSSVLQIVVIVIKFLLNHCYLVDSYTHLRYLLCPNSTALAFV